MGYYHSRKKRAVPIAGAILYAGRAFFIVMARSGLLRAAATTGGRAVAMSGRTALQYRPVIQSIAGSSKLATGAKTLSMIGKGAKIGGKAFFSKTSLGLQAAVYLGYAINFGLEGGFARMLFNISVMFADEQELTFELSSLTDNFCNNFHNSTLEDSAEALRKIEVVLERIEEMN